jgi:hypothetical protein
MSEAGWGGGPNLGRFSEIGYAPGLRTQKARRASSIANLNFFISGLVMLVDMIANLPGASIRTVDKSYVSVLLGD